MNDTPKKTIRVLVLNDNHSDAELAIERLRKEGFDIEWNRVETKEDYLASLNRPCDLILSNDTLAGFDAEQALQLLHEKGVDIPFVILSRVVSEEKWILLMKKGADDFISKEH